MTASWATAVGRWSRSGTCSAGDDCNSLDRSLGRQRSKPSSPQSHPRWTFDCMDDIFDGRGSRELLSKAGRDSSKLGRRLHSWESQRPILGVVPESDGWTAHLERGRSIETGATHVLDWDCGR